MEYEKFTWVTLYSTTIIHNGKVAYCYFYRWDGDKVSYTGVFKPQIANIYHAEALCIGAALKSLKTVLKDWQITGITIHTDCVLTISMLDQWIQYGSVTWSDINGLYVTGFNRCLRAVKCKRWNVQRIQMKNRDWMKASCYRKIEWVLKKEVKNATAIQLAERKDYEARFGIPTRKY